MKQGVILLTFDPERSAPDWNKAPIPNPYRTGGYFVVRDDAMRRMLKNQSTLDWALKHRFMWIEHASAEQVGLFALAQQAKPEGT